MLEVLLNFRIGKIAVCGDIQEMFNRIQIIPVDQHCQRFLWRDGDETKPLKTYVMTAMIFGATCSPCSAQFVKNLNAKKHMEENKLAAEAILNNHYVDDFVMSFDSEEEAVMVTKGVCKIHSYGNLNLRNFVSNSKKVLEHLEMGSIRTHILKIP